MGMQNAANVMTSLCLVTGSLDVFRTLPKSVLMVVCIFVSMASSRSAQIQGSVARCHNEGENVFVAGISTDPCITCVCKMREVVCNRQTCASNEGCHLVLFDKPRDQCCEECKGCVYQGMSYKSGTQWTDPRDPCLVHTCQAGVLTTSIQRCHVTCKNPYLVEGQCCPICEGCYVNGVLYREGQIFPSSVDPCSTCVCQNGSTSCSRELCPVVNCIPDHQYTPLGSCCPRCKGSRHIYPPPGGKCLYQRHIQENGSQINPDICTHCTCMDGTLSCDRKSCPILNCATSDVIHDNNTCCPVCKHNKLRCKLYGKKYPHGAVWKLDLCTHCLCDDGTVRCQTESCQNTLECPNNTRLKMVPGRCCPQCVDDGAICSVFGDPHYKTFDGRIFNFQGPCDYILAQTRTSGRLTVIVRNEARVNDQYAWTKSVRVHIGGAKVYLLQRNRVKVNRKPVKLPYVHRRSKFSVVTDGRLVSLKIASGIKILWDGDSYVEVYVPAKMKNLTKGLCGNYNNDKSDDFIGRGGAMYIDSDQFANSWLVGPKWCRRRSVSSAGVRQSPCLSDRRRQEAAKAACRVLYSSELDKCRARHDVQPYFSSCVTDMCECQTGSLCFCVSLLAYVRACALIGYDVDRYIPAACKAGTDCPKGAFWTECASACPKTCQVSHQVACPDKCRPGCQCPEGTVLFRNKCIRPEECPRNTDTEVKKDSRRQPEKRKRKKKKKFNSPLDYLIENK